MIDKLETNYGMHSNRYGDHLTFPNIRNSTRHHFRNFWSDCDLIDMCQKATTSFNKSKKMRYNSTSGEMELDKKETKAETVAVP